MHRDKRKIFHTFIDYTRRSRTKYFLQVREAGIYEISDLMRNFCKEEGNYMKLCTAIISTFDLQGCRFQLNSRRLSIFYVYVVIVCLQSNPEGRRGIL